MRYTATCTLTLSAILKLISAKSEEFGLVAIRSGSALQYAGVYAKNGTLYFGYQGNSSLSAVVTDCGLLQLSDNSFATVSNGGILNEGDQFNASSGFSIAGGHLIYNGLDGFYAIPEDTNYLVSVEGTGNAIGVAIRAQGTSGQPVADYYPNKHNCTYPKKNVTTTTYTSVSTSSKSHQTSQSLTTSHLVLVANEGGAINMGITFGVGAVAAAVALLI